LAGETESGQNWGGRQGWTVSIFRELLEGLRDLRHCGCPRI
jgi:hypothetical protein